MCPFTVEGKDSTHTAGKGCVRQEYASRNTVKPIQQSMWAADHEMLWDKPGRVNTAVQPQYCQGNQFAWQL
jgi:hypothetical protein